MNHEQGQRTPAEIDTCFVPHVGWMVYEKGDVVLEGLRAGDFEYVEQALFFRLLRTGDVVVDGGAHAGLFTRIAAMCIGESGRVLAVEPSPPTLPLLRRNTEGLSPTCVSLHALALAAHEGELSLHVDAPGKSAYNHVHRGGTPEDSTRVTACPLTALLREAGLDRVDLLKLDVEGSEVAVLEGARPLLEAGKIGAILIEFNEENLRRLGSSCVDLQASLAESGYTLYSMDSCDLSLSPAGPIRDERYANFLATRDVGTVKQRLAETPQTARQIADDILARGATVGAERKRLHGNLADQRTYIATLTAEAARLERELNAARVEGKRLQERLHEQENYIITLRMEGARLKSEATTALDESTRMRKVMGEQRTLIDSLQREVARLELEGKAAREGADRLAKECQKILLCQSEASATAQAHIDRLLNESQTASLRSQKHINELLAENARMAEVIGEQDNYIRLLKESSERARSDGTLPPPG